ncbi:MAG: substrate-binding domain-containing protein [bacterium]
MINQINDDLLLGRRFYWLLIILLLFTGCGPKPTVKGSNKSLKVAIISREVSTPYLESLIKGAQRAATEQKAVLVFQKLPQEEDPCKTVQCQVNALQEAIKSKVDAIVLDPVDTNALAASIKSAVDSKIPVVLIESGPDAKLAQAIIGPDSTDTGKKAARQLVSLINNKGTIVFLPAAAIDSLQQQRISFTLAVKQERKIKVIECAFPVLDSHPDLSALNITLDALNKSTPDLKGIYIAHETAIPLVLEYIRTHPSAKKWKIVAYGMTTESLHALKQSKTIQCLITPDAESIGYCAVTNALRILHNESFEPKKAIPMLVLKK